MFEESDPLPGTVGSQAAGSVQLGVLELDASERNVSSTDNTY
jgi:hypothetical protein